MRQHPNTFQTTEWRRLHPSKGHERIRARFGFEHIQGNARPHFSVTAEIAEPYHGRRTDEDVVEIPPPEGYNPETDYWWPERWILNGGGCCHEDVARVLR